MEKQVFGKKERVRRRKDYLNIYKKGTADPLRQFHCYIEPQSIRRKEAWNSSQQKSGKCGKEKQDQTPFKKSSSD